VVGVCEASAAALNEAVPLRIGGWIDRGHGAWRLAVAVRSLPLLSCS
jgi:hypothetical protein